MQKGVRSAGLVNTNYVEQAQQARMICFAYRPKELKAVEHEVVEARNSRSKQVTTLLTTPGHVVQLLFSDCLVKSAVADDLPGSAGFPIQAGTRTDIPL